MTLLHHVTPALSPARLGQIVGAVAAEPRYWSDVVRFDTGRRWYQRLDLADDYEIWLLTWTQGQSTGFHDHGDAAGAFAVVQGQVRERTVTAARPLVSRPRCRGGRLAGRSARSTCTTWPTSAPSRPSPCTPTRRRSPTCAGTS